MLSQGNISVTEVQRLLRRHWWILPVTICAAGLVGFIATLFLPKKYMSSTMVLVEPPAVAAEVVPAAMNEDLYRHLASMKEQILSRSRLQPLIQKFNLFPNSQDMTRMDDMVDSLKQMIDVELIQRMPGSMDRQPPGFHVSVTLGNPQVAQQVCTEITSMFMEQNASTQEKRLKDTTSFLTQQLAEAKADLDTQDNKLAEFKKEHLRVLPEEEQSNLSLLSGMNSQLDAITQAIGRAQQDKTLNESLLTQQETIWNQTQQGLPNADSLDAQLEALQDQLSSLLSRYTPQHPDVIKTKEQIAEVKRRMAAGNSSSATAEPKGNETKGSETQAQSPTQAHAHQLPQMQQLRTKIKEDELNIADLLKHQSQIQKQIATIEAHIQASPVVEQQIKELTRNYQTALDHYNDLLKNQQKSAMLTDLHGQQQGETFRVLDPPSLPVTPSYPKKFAFIGGGAAAGLVLAAGILCLLAMADKAMYTEGDVELCLKVPVLTLVPSLDVSHFARITQSKRRKEITIVGTKA